MSLEGRVLDEKYEIVRRIGEGGTSAVYLAVHRRIGKLVAVKVLRAPLSRDFESLERFDREAWVVSRIRSPNIADVFDSGELPTGERYMVMEYLEGESLAAILARKRTLPADQLTEIALQLLDALAAAHRAGVIHRDLKPENVIITERDGNVVVKLVDFGIAKALEAGARRVEITAAGSVLGTPLYMSPEQARGHTNLVDHRTDIYSLGVMLYEATAGGPPLTGENVNDLLFRVALEEPEPLSRRVESIDPMLSAIVRRAMAKDPADRFQSAVEMRKAVEAWRAALASRSARRDARAAEPRERKTSRSSRSGRANGRAPGASAVLRSAARGRRSDDGRKGRVRVSAGVLLAVSAPLVVLLVFFGAPIARGLVRALPIVGPLTVPEEIKSKDPELHRAPPLERSPEPRPTSDPPAKGSAGPEAAASPWRFRNRSAELSLTCGVVGEARTACRR